LSEYRKQRRDVIAAELTRTFYSVDLADALILVRRPPATARLMNSESAAWNTNGQPSLSIWP